jgi:hypothetical protein
MPSFPGALRVFTVAAIAFAATGDGSLYGQTTQNMAGVKFVAEVPLVECDGTPCVDARISDGRMIRLAIDTGNADSVVDSKVAEVAGLKPSAPPKPGAPAGMSRTILTAVHIGTLTLIDVPAIRMDLSEMISQKQMPHVGGTLAYPAFKDRIVQLDFAAHKLRVSEVLTAHVKCTGACDTMALITFGKEGPPIVVADGFQINGVNLSAQVDTMYTGSLLVYTASIEKLSLSGAAQTTETRLFPLTDGGVNMKVAQAQQEGFNGILLAKDGAKVYFPTETVHEPDGLFDATVGLELFRDAVLTLDFHDMTIGVSKAVRPS